MKINKKEKKWDVPHTGSPNVMSRIDVLRYYMRPSVAESIVGGIKNGPAMVYSMFDGGRVLRRKIGDKFINIRRVRGDTPDALEYWVKRHAVEFHRVFTGKEKEGIVDIDPNQVPADRVKAIVKAVGEVMRKYGKPEIQFSGNRGFYVKVKLKMDSFRKLYNNIKNDLRDRFSGEQGITYTKKPQPGQVRLDLSPMKRLGSYRAPLSLDSRTGLVSGPVADIDKFDRLRDAAPGGQTR
jgi:hypothetical protein